jgi:serine/threonine protein kinase
MGGIFVQNGTFSERSFHRTHSHTAPETLKPRYYSPTQNMTVEPVSEKSDVYSFGALMLEWLLQRSDPSTFFSKSMDEDIRKQEMMDAICNGNFGVQISVQFVEVIQSCLKS